MDDFDASYAKFVNMLEDTTEAEPMQPSPLPGPSLTSCLPEHKPPSSLLLRSQVKARAVHTSKRADVADGSAPSKVRHDYTTTAQVQRLIITPQSSSRRPAANSTPKKRNCALVMAAVAKSASKGDGESPEKSKAPRVVPSPQSSRAGKVKAAQEVFFGEAKRPRLGM
eukprot:TRINITY_DN55560_c0_g1_i1.p2 TRINITY_DN55560_c0_g1~~TRINITY_DN55560_c0_g1_i1.p2  ORF type:complete len:168 (-),score=45.87 TRINITY_DN55560_c0_g1_i1:37-540(-)